MRKWLLLGVFLMLAGCSNKTETGYEPRKLGASENVQRGYYAQPFSPQSRAAEQEQQTEMSNRRPGEWKPY